MPRRNKADNVTVNDVAERLLHLHMEDMANRLKELDASGELTSSSALEIVNDLAVTQEIATSNNTVARYNVNCKIKVTNKCIQNSPENAVIGYFLRMA